MKVRDANSFEPVAREWYGKRSHTWVAPIATDVLRRLESNLFPDLGDKPIAAITAPALLAAARKIELAARMTWRIACYRSHRRYSATAWQPGAANAPPPDLRGALTPHKAKHQAAVTPEELPALLRAIDGYGELGDRMTGYALQLLALTFVRTNELIGAEWERIRPGGRDLDRAGRAHEDESRACRAALAAGLGDPARAACDRRRQPLRFPRPQPGQAHQQQHDTVRALPAWLQGEDDRARLPRRRVDDAERSRLPARRDRAPARALRAQRDTRGLQSRRVSARAHEDDAAMGRHARRPGAGRAGDSAATQES